MLQQTYSVSQTSPPAITDIYMGWPSRKTFGSWPEASSSRVFIQLRDLITLSLIHHTFTKSLLKGQACSPGHGRHWPNLPRSFQKRGKGQ